MSDEDEMCHCGRPLHYRDPEARAKVEDLISHLGEYQTVVVLGEGTWRVPRHYIALHGLNAEDAPSLGFERLR